MFSRRSLCKVEQAEKPTTEDQPANRRARFFVDHRLERLRLQLTTGPCRSGLSGQQFAHLDGPEDHRIGKEAYCGGAIQPSMMAPNSLTPLPLLFPMTAMAPNHGYLSIIQP